MANIRGTTGSILGTISSTATTITSLIGAAEQSTQLLTNRINASLQEQEMRLKLEAVDLRDRLIDEMAETSAERKTTIAKKLANDSVLEAAFNDARAKLEAALK